MYILWIIKVPFALNETEIEDSKKKYFSKLEKYSINVTLRSDRYKFRHAVRWNEKTSSKLAGNTIHIRG